MARSRYTLYMVLGALLLTGPFVIPLAVDWGLLLFSRTYMAEVLIFVDFDGNRGEIKEWIEGGELVQGPARGSMKIRFYGSDRQKVMVQTKEATAAVLRNCSGVHLLPQTHVWVKRSSPNRDLIRFWSFFFTLPLAGAGFIFIVAGMIKMVRAQTPPSLPQEVPP